MDNPNGEWLLAVSRKMDSLEFTCDFLEFLSNPSLYEKKIAVLTVTGIENNPWKKFLLNALLVYLECDGTGNWLGAAWKSRNRDLLQRGEVEEFRHGIYVWSKPLVVENSVGESIVLLANVVHRSPSCPLLALAGLISTTLITTSQFTFESSAMDLLGRFILQNGNDLFEKLGTHQLVAIIFDFQATASTHAFGATNGLTYLSEVIRNNNTELFLARVENKECWLLPEQRLDTAQPGKDFAKHVKKLFSSSILDSDSMPYLSTTGKGLSDHFLYCMENVKTALKTETFLEPNLLAAGSSDQTFGLLNEACWRISEDQEMLDLSDLKITSDSHNMTGLATSAGCLSKNHVSVSDFGRNEASVATASSSVATELQNPRRVLTSQEKDERFHQYATKQKEEYRNWLHSRPSSEVMEEAHEEEVRLILKRLESFCLENDVNKTEENMDMFSKLLSMEYQAAWNSRKRSIGSKSESHRNQTECNYQSHCDTLPTGSQRIATSTHQVSKDLNQTEIVNLWQKLTERSYAEYCKMMNHKINDLECILEDIEKCHREFEQRELLKITELLKSQNAACESENAISFSNILMSRFEHYKLILEKNQDEKREQDNKIEESLNEYDILAANTLLKIFQNHIMDTVDQFNQEHVKIVKQLTPKSLKYRDYNHQNMEKLVRKKRKPFDEAVNAIIEYFRALKKHFDSYISLSSCKLAELSTRIEERLLKEFKHNDLTPTLMEGLTIARSFAAARNATIVQDELRQAEYAISQTKNLYNHEMKLRLESSTAWRNQDLQQMHEELKKDCMQALREACNFHQDSGIPDQEPRLCQELDRSFKTYLSANEIKLDKSIRTIRAAIRKYKDQYVDIMEKKLKVLIPIHEYDSVHSATFTEVSKLLEMEIRNISSNEKVEVHRSSLRTVVETEMADLKSENHRKWKEKLEKDSEDRKRILKFEAEKKQREKEENDRTIQLEMKRKSEARHAKELRDKEQRNAETARQEFQKQTTPSSSGRGRGKITQPQPNTSSVFDSQSTSGLEPRRSPTPLHTYADATRNSESRAAEVDSFTIAVEFGLTKIRAGVLKDGKLELIPNEWGNQCDENILWLGESSFGIGQRGQEIDSTCCSMKEVMIDTNYRPQQRLFGGEELRKELLYALILSKIKTVSETYLERKISGVVLTVPLWYNSKQRQETKDAAIIAGFSNVRLINETTAVALGCALDESRLHSSNELLVVVRNVVCDAAVYSYSKSEIKMLSNCGEAQLAPSSGGLFQSVLRGIRSLWRNPHADVIQKVINMSIRKAEEKLKNQKPFQMNEAAIADTCKPSEYSVKSTAQIWTGVRLARPPLDPSSFIIAGAAHLADQMSSGQKIIAIKDLCTFAFKCQEDGDSKPKLKQIFPDHSPCPNPQKLSFGNKRELQIIITEGDECLGCVDLYLDPPPTPTEPTPTEVVSLEASFNLGADGVLSPVVKAAASGNGSKRWETKVIPQFNNLRAEHIQKLKNLVGCMSSTPV